MTEYDVLFMKKILADSFLKGPVLELGAGYGGGTSKKLIQSAGLEYFGTDIERMTGVDFVADFDRVEDMKVFKDTAPFGTILVLNVLEHTFEPIRILDNAMTLLKSGGHCVIVTPSVWPLHNYPMDSWRILPNFYEEYAKRRGFKLDKRCFDYVGFGPVTKFRDKQGDYSYPPPSSNKVHYFYSRVVHKIFNTCGRGMYHVHHVAVGVVLEKP